MQNTLIARTFAQAFYNVISKDENKEQIFTEYQNLVEGLRKRADFLMFLETPKVNRLEKKEFLEKAFRHKFHDLLVNLLQLLTNKGYLSKVIDIYEELKSIYELEGGKVKVFVTTAIPLNDEVRSNLLKSLENKFKKPIILVEKVDANILGGFVFRVDNTLVDGSLKLQLEKIGNCILERSKTYGI